MAGLGQKAKDIWVRVKDFFGKMSKKMRILLCAGGVGVILFAVIVTVSLNSHTTEYQAIFPEMTAGEATDVYRTLLDMGAQPKMDSAGKVTVPSEEYDIWLLALVDEGFPRTTTTYDVYSQFASITATETDREKGSLFQLQEQMRATLLRMNGVTDATVNITIPESTNYVWEQADENQQHSTASVLLRFKDDVTLTPEQVNTVKNLVAKGVPKMQAEDVTVVDAKSSLELYGTAEEDEENGLTSNQTVELEKIVQKQLEQNVESLLAARYGSGGVTASAKVTLDFDTMIKEQLEIAPPDEEGNRDEDHITEAAGSYGVGGQETIGGMAGEENNTDIPVYPYATPGAGNDTTYYTWDTKLDYSYIKTQVEKNGAPIKQASISVMVDEASMTQARRDELTNLVANATSIPVELISVSAFNPDNITTDQTGEPAEPVTPSIWETLPWWVYLAAAGVLVVLILLMVILIRRSKKKKARLLAAKMAEDQAAQMQAEEEIEDYKKQLSAAAKSNNNPKDEAILGEVREFAKENPEITAGLLRSWLRESD